LLRLFKAQQTGHRVSQMILQDITGSACLLLSQSEVAHIIEEASGGTNTSTVFLARWENFRQIKLWHCHQLAAFVGIIMIKVLFLVALMWFLPIWVVYWNLQHN
jgi:hypothetical protein